MPQTTSYLSEAELHGLIDGHLEADRRADVLRRAVASPGDRKRIESWQEQADLIRAAFEGVDKEQLPSSLDLRPPPRLKCVPATSPAPATSTRTQHTGVRRRLVAAVTTIAAIAGAGSWLALSKAPTRVPPSRPSEVESFYSVDDVLVRRAADAFADVISARPSSGTIAMPTATIPDLTPVGFMFSAAEALRGAHTVLVFRYRGTGAEQVVVGISSAPSNGRSFAAETSDGTLIWRAGANAFAVAGTVTPDRLRAVAASLRTAAVDE